MRYHHSYSYNFCCFNLSFHEFSMNFRSCRQLTRFAQPPDSYLYTKKYPKFENCRNFCCCCGWFCCHRCRRHRVKDLGQGQCSLIFASATHSKSFDFFCPRPKKNTLWSACFFILLRARTQKWAVYGWVGDKIHSFLVSARTLCGRRTFS